jgi:hypothetical protein
VFWVLLWHLQVGIFLIFPSLFEYFIFLALFLLLWLGIQISFGKGMGKAVILVFFLTLAEAVLVFLHLV